MLRKENLNGEQRMCTLLINKSAHEYLDLPRRIYLANPFEWISNQLILTTSKKILVLLLANRNLHLRNLIQQNS